MNHTQTSEPQPRVGIGVFVFRSRNDRHFLLGLRKGSHGAGTLSLAGGHLEYNETFSTCAERETREETGLEIKDVQFLTAVESFFEEKHYVTIFVTGFVKEDGAAPKLMEPDKCEGWYWYSFRGMRELSEKEPGRLFVPLRNLIAQRGEVCTGLERQEGRR